MSGGIEESNVTPGGGEPSEDELRAAWEEQLRMLTPADVIVQTTVSLISLAGRRLGVEPGTEDERDLGQVRDAIDGARALMPLLERGEAGPTLGPLREAISALQFEYAKLAGVPAAAAGAAAPTGGTGGAGGSAPSGDTPVKAPADAGKPDAGPAQRSGRLWVPGS
jgi:hypothetical protein